MRGEESRQVLYLMGPVGAARIARKDGKPWGRLNEEFEDGRFEALSALPPPAGSETGER